MNTLEEIEKAEREARRELNAKFRKKKKAAKEKKQAELAELFTQKVREANDLLDEKIWNRLSEVDRQVLFESAQVLPSVDRQGGDVKHEQYEQTEYQQTETW